MVEISNELMYETLKAVRADTSQIGNDITELRSELPALRTHVSALVQSDARHYGEMAALRERVERIERRLEISG
jgi:predicted nuclease with TOPRIM domain